LPFSVSGDLGLRSIVARAAFFIHSSAHPHARYVEQLFTQLPVVANQHCEADAVARVFDQFIRR
jgi:hypothetical protein